MHSEHVFHITQTLLVLLLPRVLYTVAVLWCSRLLSLVYLVSFVIITCSCFIVVFVPAAWLQQGACFDTDANSACHLASLIMHTSQLADFCCSNCWR